LFSNATSKGIPSYEILSHFENYLLFLKKAFIKSLHSFSKTPEMT
jgi:hypothetical protein